MTPADLHLSSDPIMATLISQITLIKINPQSEPFNALIRSIVSQQLSVKAANTIYKRFENKCGPTPQADRLIKMDIETLRTFGISRQKASYIQNVAQHRIDNPEFWGAIHSLSSEEITQTLIQIKGVGEWTVKMLLIFNLKMPDVFPIKDLIIRNSICNLYSITAKGKERTANLLEIGDKWRPFRTRASRYLWAAKDL